MHAYRTILGVHWLYLRITFLESKAIEKKQLVFFRTAVEDNQVRIQLSTHEFGIIHSFNKLNLYYTYNTI